MSIQYTSLPPEYRAEAQAYVESGLRPSALLLAVLDNNLTDTLNHLPDGLDAEQRLALMNALAVWATLDAPAMARGGVILTEAWMRSGGLVGRRAARQAEAATQQANASARATSDVSHLQPALDTDAATTGRVGNVYGFPHLADLVARYGPLQAL